MERPADSIDAARRIAHAPEQFEHPIDCGRCGSRFWIGRFRLTSFRFGGRGWFDHFSGLLQAEREVALVTPTEMREAQIERFIDRVGWVAECEEFDGGIDPVAASL